MPRYRRFCTHGEVPTSFVQGKEFEDTFGIKTFRHPSQGVNRSGYCHSHVPREWVSSVKWLVDKIARVYGIKDGINQNNGCVRIDQIKDKFGSLRFYYSAPHEIIRSNINKWIERCEEMLKLDDPYYGKPY